jgi:hypothetical protein
VLKPGADVAAAAEAARDCVRDIDFSGATVAAVGALSAVTDTPVLLAGDMCA